MFELSVYLGSLMKEPLSEIAQYGPHFLLMNIFTDLKQSHFYFHLLCEDHDHSDKSILHLSMISVTHTVS